MRAELRIVALLARLHLQRLRHDRAALVWLAVMPLVFSLVMGAMFGSWEKGPPPVVLVGDAGGGAAAAAVRERLPANDRYRVAVVDTPFTRAAARRAVFARGRPAALWLPAGYPDAAPGDTAVLFWDSERLSAQAARTDLERVLRGLAARRLAAALADSSRDGRFRPGRFDSLWAHPRLRLRAEALGRTAGLPFTLRNGRQHVGPAYTLMFVLMLALMGARDRVAQRRLGTFRRLRLGGASAFTLAAGLFAGPFLVGLLQFAFLLAANHWLLGIDYGAAPGLLAVTALLFTAVSAALALWLAAVSRTPEQAAALGTVVSLLTAALGGLWWPLEITPVWMQKLGLWLPTGRAVTIFHDMIGRGDGLAQASGHVVVLAAWAVVALLMAARTVHRLGE